MPLITLTVRKPKSTAFKKAVLDAVHGALVASGVPPKGRFQRVIELEPADFIYDDSYPDLARPRDAEFILIEVLWSVGRSVKVKRKVLADILEALAKDPGADPEDVFVVFKETQWENWAFGGGRII